MRIFIALIMLTLGSAAADASNADDRELCSHVLPNEIPAFPVQKPRQLVIAEPIVVEGVEIAPRSLPANESERPLYELLLKKCFNR
ncbi:hypothetical protein V1281_001894 [Nitrobacteraceae bacterium AZCC 2161]